MTDVTKSLLTLPEFVFFEGMEFSLSVFKNHSDEMRLVYDITSVSEDSPHKKQYDEYNCWENPFIREEGYTCGFLFLAEGIGNDKSMLRAIQDCKQFLLKNKLFSE